MTRITNVDQVLMLLRQQLQRMSRSDAAARPGRIGKSDADQRKSALERIEAVSRNDDLSDDELARNLIGALLVDQFGEAIANDIKFQTMLGEVHRIIASDAQTKRLLRAALQQVKAC